MQITEDVQLRPASHADGSEVAALLRRCGLPADDTDDIIDAFHVALEKGRIIGCAAVEQGGKSIVVRSVAVDPVYRDRGVASRLIETLLLRAHGAVRAKRISCRRARRPTLPAGASPCFPPTRRRPKCAHRRRSAVRSARRRCACGAICGRAQPRFLRPGVLEQRRRVRAGLPAWPAALPVCRTVVDAVRQAGPMSIGPSYSPCPIPDSLPGKPMTPANTQSR